jgi:hypothetical protein
MQILGEIISYEPESGRMLIETKFEDYALLSRRQIREVGIEINDGRQISVRQRNKIFCLVKDIADYFWGFQKPITSTKSPDYQSALAELGLMYVYDKSDCEQARTALMLQYCALSDQLVFSLSEVDMTTAREFITWLIEMFLKHDIPSSRPLSEQAEDIARYVYACLANKKCAVCGKPSDLHHVDRVGMGRDRRSISHLGLRVLPLCREHHNLAHQSGDENLMKDWHLEPVKLDENLCEIYGLKK